MHASIRYVEKDQNEKDDKTTTTNQKTGLKQQEVDPRSLLRAAGKTAMQKSMIDIASKKIYEETNIYSDEFKNTLMQFCHYY
jgi:hypothetical protein